MKKISIVLSLLLISFASCSFTSKKLDNPDKDKLLIEIVQHILANKHFSPAEINDAFSKQMYKNYIENLDAQKRYFLQSDINEFKKYEMRLDDDLKNDDLTFFNLTYERLITRMKEAQEIAQEILKKPINFSSKENINTDFEKLSYVKNKSELQNRWKQIITFSVLSNYTTKEKEENTKKEKDAKYQIKPAKELQKEAIENTEKTFLDLFSFYNEITKQEWFNIYVNAITETFDPHSNYMAPDIKDNFDRDISGKFEGIGAQLQKKHDGVHITNIISGGPVWKGKLLEVGDIIIKVAQKNEEPVDVVGMRLDDVVKLIKGPKGTEVRLTVKRVDGTIAIIPIIRDVVELEETFAKSAIIKDGDKNYGIINLPKFYIDFKDQKERNAASDMALEIEKLKKENIDGLIVDLRNNGGGSLKTVVDIAGLFIKNGPVVQVKSPRGRIDVLSDNDPRIQWSGSLVILTNELSASASEILAAAMQDYKRAIVIGGKQTYGKGTVQGFEDLNNYVRRNSFGDLGALKYTIQKFYRINGGSTQLEGVKSDIVTPDKYKYIDIGERDLPNAMKWDNIDPVKFNTWEHHSNFNKAIENSNKRISENTHLKLIDENAKWIKQQRDKNVFPLNYEAYKKVIEKDEQDAKRFKAINDYKSNLKFVSLPSEEEKVKTDENLKLSRDRWHENLQKDVYVNEAVNVLKDLNS
ncbi:carboxy terminal-processing peptidase [Capnocytophaga sp.]|uniref:carboxy terminal-processing peptidase n=1 Tax=Capnocytophaga sp. TaxID=44737 RepID=UPI0026DDA057|nr:carboxy terminal-processing peptidase [Capnocytophaga sp.]MDO5105537.1 carboxy terminal-processing peptidase [Capnocytophaga sp.]